jgi:hypothetical protein
MSGNRDFEGASGYIYRYLHIENDQMTPLGAGNFLYARPGKSRALIVIYAGETERLTTGIGEKWDEAVKRHGAADIYARRNVSSRTRLEEQADLVAAYAPVMNTPAPEPSAAPE